MDEQETHKNQGVQVIARAAAILRLLGQETEGLSLGKIAKKVNLPRSTVQRIVTALAAEGFISTEKGYGGIMLGPEIQSLAQASTSGLRDRLRPVMQRLSNRTGETVDLAVLEGGRMLFIDQIVGSHRLRAVSSIGEAFPLTDTANGKAALACLDATSATKLVVAEAERREDLRKPLPDIVAEIDRIRHGAPALDEDEHTDGISAIGFATRDIDGDVLAISVPVPSSRYKRTKPALLTAIDECRKELDPDLDL